MTAPAFLDKAVLATGLAALPIRVFRGPLRGLWWTPYPHSAYWRGRHEPEIGRWLAAQRERLTAATAWDIGAHFGYYSLILARMVGPAGAVHAFEPNPANVRKLQRHAALNRRRPLRVWPVAVGAAPGEARLYSYAGGFDTTGHLPFPGETVEQAPHSWAVRMIRLDDEVEAGRLGAPAFIKLDAEGHGAHAIAGAAQAIARQRPLILAGLHGHEEADGIESVLRPLGYRRLDLHGQPAGYDGGLADVVYAPPA